VRVPAHARAMDTWALVKVMAFGRAYYTASVPIAVGYPDNPDQGTDERGLSERAQP
jgi:hypothetical protein